MANEPRYVTCSCQHCSGHIEFDGGDFEPGETCNVACPHCQLETIIFVPRQGQAPKAVEKTVPHSAKPPVLNSQTNPPQVELFFYKVNEEEKGPYTLDQLRSFWSNGQITANAVFRTEKASEWKPLAAEMAKKPKSSLPIQKLGSLLLKAALVLSLIAFFLPNVNLSFPIFGVISVSMFDFVSPKSNQGTTTGDQSQQPDIKDQINLSNFHITNENIGLTLCAVSVLGLMAHYLLTVIYGLLTILSTRTFSWVERLWLSCAIQFPILFLIGAHLAVSSMKNEALVEASKGSADTGEALGNALGVAFVNHVSIQPGPIMWLLMVVASVCFGLPYLARQLKQ